MKTKLALIFLLIVVMGFVVGCKEEPIPEPEPEPEKQEAPALTQKINEFIEAAMEDVYLWYKELPDIDTRYEFDPKAYFDKLLYTEDKWSYVTDDIEALENSFQGKEKSFGWSLGFGRFSDTQTIFGLVEFVYPNTPAAQAGMKRGDIIFQISNADITDENYTDMLYADNLTFTSGQYTETGITNVSTKTMSSRELNLDPVIIKKIIEHEGYDIGYVFYAQFISNFNSSLDSAFQYFLDEGISHVIVDLRYNPGGYTSAAQHLASSLAPLGVVNSSSTLVTFQWNDKYQQYWQNNNVTSQLEVKFVNNVPVKMGLQKVYFLTGSGTASASELCITGLKPYMDVTTVGETTYGKYTASITLKPEDFYENQSYYSDFDNWGIQPIVIRYANSQGVTDFKDGFIPDIPVEDDIWGGIPLGDKNDALIKKAIEDITGTPLALVKSAVKIPEHKIFDRGFSRFDSNKREMVFDNFNSIIR